MLIKKVYLLGSLMKNQWKSKEYLENLRDKKLRFLIKHVYNNNQFYHRIYKEYKETIFSFKGFKDLHKLPLIEKEDIQKYSCEVLKEQFLHSKIEGQGNYSVNGYTVRKTSGSLGKPLSVIYDSDAWEFSELMYARALFASGYKATETLVLSYPYTPPKKKLLNYFGVMNKKYVLPSLDAKEQLATLLKERKKFVFHSFPSILLMLSKEIEEINRMPNTKAIISIGESLDMRARKRIRDAFGCEVYNHYGAMEFNRIAWECNQHEGLHINIDAVALEFIKNKDYAAEGEKGEIIATGLYNFAFPLIRYRLGDFGKISNHNCSCGRGLPLMDHVTGRQFDFIMKSDSRLIPPAVTDTMLNSIRGISQFKLMQEKNRRLNLYLVKKEGFEGDIKSEAMQQLLKLDANVKARVIITRQIKRNEGGKLSSVVSKAAQNNGI